LSYATFGIEEENDVVISSAPITKWTIGKNINFVLNYFRNKGAKIELV
jgi:hypothetical protein